MGDSGAAYADRHEDALHKRIKRHISLGRERIGEPLATTANARPAGRGWRTGNRVGAEEVGSRGFEINRIDRNQAWIRLAPI